MRQRERVNKWRVLALSSFQTCPEEEEERDEVSMIAPPNTRVHPTARAKQNNDSNAQNREEQCQIERTRTSRATCWAACGTEWTDGQ